MRCECLLNEGDAERVYGCKSLAPCRTGSTGSSAAAPKATVAKFSLELIFSIFSHQTARVHRTPNFKILWLPVIIRDIIVTHDYRRAAEQSPDDELLNALNKNTKPSKIAK